MIRQSTAITVVLLKMSQTFSRSSNGGARSPSVK